MSVPRILIVTAPFGEGHNSAARNLALALRDHGAEVRIEDPCLLGAPLTTRVLGWGYRFVTNHLPRVWARIYRSADHTDFSRPGLPGMRKPEHRLGALVDGWQPDLVVSTYPIYPYFLKRHRDAGGREVPVATVVTDSIEINAAWTKAPTDCWLVTDGHTRDGMIRSGLAADRVVDTGFPVHPVFARRVPPADGPRPDVFRVLYFATARRGDVPVLPAAMLAAGEEVRVTVVMGRNVRRHLRGALELRAAHPGRVRLIGWTRRVPELLASHHCVVGKAGGATVHESIAAGRPMLIHHLVPGQEEGNLKLLESLGAGCLAGTPESLTAALRAMLAGGRSGWRSMCGALARHGHADGAERGARYLLERYFPTWTS